MKCELLAPAKDLHKAKTAIRYGADAVYIGGKDYSLRSRASNFTEEDMQEAVRFAHEHGARLYVTVNIVFHDEDLYGVREYLQRLESYGVDAVIIESLGLLQIGKKAAPKLEYHISTQLSSLNSASVAMLKEMGADRVVLGRETSMEQIEAIAENSDLPLEVFIHGGMCANYSGRCTLSNHLTLRDANRGGCAQSCRWHYHLCKDGEELSPEDDLFSMGSTDLMAVPYVERMKKAGIASLKIEGRMKSDYYIAAVVKTYRDLLDEIERFGTPDEERIHVYEKELAKAQNRRFGCGFLDGAIDETRQLYKEGEGAAHDYVGYVLSYDPETHWAEVSTRNVFDLHEQLEILRPQGSNIRFQNTLMKDGEGNELIHVRRPNETIQVYIPFAVEAHSMLRKVRS